MNLGRGGPCWFCNPPLGKPVPDREAGLCIPCKRQLADFVAWMHRNDRAG